MITAEFDDCFIVVRVCGGGGVPVSVHCPHRGAQPCLPASLHCPGRCRGRAVPCTAPRHQHSPRPPSSCPASSFDQNVYVPNSGAGLKRLDYRLTQWDTGAASAWAGGGDDGDGRGSNTHALPLQLHCALRVTPTHRLTPPPRCPALPHPAAPPLQPSRTTWLAFRSASPWC